MVLGPGDRAPHFALPAAYADGNVSLAEYLGRGPVFLTMLRGLYCPFCRRHVSQLRPACEALKASGITHLGIVVASPERARQYFQTLSTLLSHRRGPRSRNSSRLWSARGRQTARYSSILGARSRRYSPRVGFTIRARPSTGRVRESRRLRDDERRRR